MIGLWVLSKPYAADGGTFPVAWSYGHNHIAFGYQGNGWSLVYLSCDAHQAAFIVSGTDPNVVYVGTEWDAPPQLLLDTYSSSITPGKTYTSVGQVLADLGKADARFIEQRDPTRF